MVVLFVALISIAAAFSNALSGVFQRIVAGTPSPNNLFSLRFIEELVKHKLWVAGFAFDILGFLLQAVALNQGSIVIVEAVMTTDLIFILLLLNYRHKVGAGWREWGGVVGICLGLSGLLLAAHPRGGHLNFNPVNWIVLSVIVGIIIVATVLFTRRIGNSLVRAGITGIATGLNFALTAGLVKLAVRQLHHGLPYLLSHWVIYAVIISAIVSFFMIQNTYGAGSLAISQPALEIVEPIAGAFIGLILFGDTINLSPLALAGEVISSLALGVGVVLLGSSKKILQSKL
jgi:drug/metabolite transporter (DMT)-like permease